MWTASYHPSLKGIEMPVRIARLPVDSRGFPVPRFVALVKGEPDHRIVDPRWIPPAIKDRRCWICGEPMGRYYASIIGPMCAINRVISEPPSHRDCAEFAVKACPFMARPQAHRRDAGMPENRQDAPGNGLPRNPGVACLWISREYPKPFQSKLGHPGVLFALGEPVETVWYRLGRRATHAEVVSSFHAGMPALIASAQSEGREAEDELALQASRALAYLPA